ncbi:MAG: hypothetical protein BLM47_08200 [Candidatus Reconcilbacillus cellulovorans]|uniref:Cell cycle protein n=1 Tax=Candidatus Reconcilbacillus cellulovorans TaxID=1906605 RepID=A0A2A6DZR5_9BACL|nr:MAG: hypothetical protein BLM47_08200 [Candidatus Reconcilbacillus cellulovorans]
MVRKLKRLDAAIVALLAAMAAFSTALIYSAVYGTPNEGLHVRNLIHYAAGFGLFLAVAMLDYRRLLRAAPYLYAAGVLLLLLVLRFGTEINGSRGWFRFGGFSFQPAEAAKFVLVIALSAFLGRRRGEPLRFWRDWVPLGALVAVPFTLTIVQPDLGNAVIYLFILVAMLWVGQAKYTHVAAALVVVAVVAALFVVSFEDLREPLRALLERWLHKGHWVDRIDMFLNPEAGRADVYHVEKAYIAIGSGRWIGDGFLQGNSVHKRFIPYVYSDSIVVVAGEEFGFVGMSVLLLAYFLLIYRMILIAIQCRDFRGAYLISGTIALVASQVFLNVGMHLKLVPFTGITLPLISYGGSSLLVLMAGFGVVASVRVHQEEPLLYAVGDKAS